jgi:hypothetical protein
MVPILWNHDHAKQIGKMTAEGNRLMVELAPGHAAPRDWFEYAFGGAGYIVLEWDGEKILKAEIVEFSLVWTPETGLTPPS